MSMFIICVAWTIVLLRLFVYAIALDDDKRTRDTTDARQNEAAFRSHLLLAI